MSKRVIFVLLVLTMFMTSCSNAGTPVRNPVVFSMLYNDEPNAPFQEDWLILDEYNKRMNVTFDVRLGDNSNYEQEVALALEGGDPPDIILKVWPGTIESYANAGLLLPFSDYESLMPNFKAYIKEHQLEDEIDKLRLSNGKYYILPGYQRQIQVQQWIYRRDIFEQHNIKAPQTYDELYDALVALKEIYPDSTPLTALWGGAHLFAMMGAGFDIPAGWNGTQAYNWEENTWQFAPATENYRAMYSYLNKCYEAGILDPEFLTQSDEQFYAKLTDGRAFVTVTWVTSGFDNWNAQLRENGIANGEWAPLRVPESPLGISALPGVDPFRKGLAVSSQVVNEPYFEDLLKFLDWAVYSEEGMTLTSWGVEDKTYVNTTDGKAFLPEVKAPRNPEGTIDPKQAYGLGMFFNLNENEAYEDYKKPPEIVAFLNASLQAEETVPLYPVLKLDPESIEVASLISEKLNPYATESGTEFITGELDIDSDWQTYLNELETRGYKTLETIWNDAWHNQN